MKLDSPWTALGRQLLTLTRTRGMRHKTRSGCELGFAWASGRAYEALGRWGSATTRAPQAPDRPGHRPRAPRHERRGVRGHWRPRRGAGKTRSAGQTKAHARPRSPRGTASPQVARRGLHMPPTRVDAPMDAALGRRRHGRRARRRTDVRRAGSAASARKWKSRRLSRIIGAWLSLGWSRFGLAGTAELRELSRGRARAGTCACACASTSARSRTDGGGAPVTGNLRRFLLSLARKRARVRPRWSRRHGIALCQIVASSPRFQREPARRHHADQRHRHVVAPAAAACNAPQRHGQRNPTTIPMAYIDMDGDLDDRRFRTRPRSRFARGRRPSRGPGSGAATTNARNFREDRAPARARTRPTATQLDVSGNACRLRRSRHSCAPGRRGRLPRRGRALDPATTQCHAGWSLVVVYSDATQPARATSSSSTASRSSQARPQWL